MASKLPSDIPGATVPLSGAGQEVPPAELVPKSHLREFGEWLRSPLGPHPSLTP